MIMSVDIFFKVIERYWKILSRKAICDIDFINILGYVKFKMEIGIIVLVVMWFFKKKMIWFKLEWLSCSWKGEDGFYIYFCS